MAETTPLLDDIDDNYPHNGEFEGETYVPPTTYFERLIKILMVITLILSAFTIALLITNYIIIRRTSISSYLWVIREPSLKLGSVMLVSLIFSIINIVVNFPFLFDLIVDVVLTPIIIQRMVHLIETFPASHWCQNWPGQERIPNCDHWRFVVTVCMGIIAGFSGIIAVIYLIKLLLRSIAIFKTKFWKRSSWAFPTGRISLQISLSILPQESTTTAKNVQSVAETGSVRGPVAGS